MCAAAPPCALACGRSLPASFSVARGEKIPHKWGPAVLHMMAETSLPWGEGAQGIPALAYTGTHAPKRPGCYARFAVKFTLVFCGFLLLLTQARRLQARPAGVFPCDPLVTPSAALSRRRKNLRPRSWTWVPRRPSGRGGFPAGPVSLRRD